MKKYKKVLAAGLALTMGLGLAACGSAGKDSGDDTAKSGEDGLSGKLVYWSMWNDTEPQGMVWQEIADGFMEEHPDVEIEIQWCGRDNKKVLKPALEGGETIDILEYPFEIDLNDYLLDLTEYVTLYVQQSDLRRGWSYRRAEDMGRA